MKMFARIALFLVLATSVAAEDLAICSFNIQFLGSSVRRDNAALSAILEEFDIYRVTPPCGDCRAFDYLKIQAHHDLGDGIHVAFGESLLPVELASSNPDASDFLLANGSFRDRSYEVHTSLMIGNDLNPRDG